MVFFVKISFFLLDIPGILEEEDSGDEDRSVGATESPSVFPGATASVGLAGARPRFASVTCPSIKNASDGHGERNREEVLESSGDEYVPGEEACYSDESGKNLHGVPH